jgi:hypothetical protein
VRSRRRNENTKRALPLPLPAVAVAEQEEMARWLVTTNIVARRRSAEKGKGTLHRDDSVSRKHDKLEKTRSSVLCFVVKTKCRWSWRNDLSAVTRRI